MLLKKLPLNIQSLVLSYHDLGQVLLMEALFDVWVVPPAVVQRAYKEAAQSKKLALCKAYT